MGKLIKKNLLKACQTTLKEYEEDRHKMQLETCSLCLFAGTSKFIISRLTRQTANGLSTEELLCIHCPMIAFGVRGCFGRLCEPFNSKDPKIVALYKDILKQRVVAFYKEVVKWIKNTSAKDLNNPNIYKELIKIDEKIDKLYSLLL